MRAGADPFGFFAGKISGVITVSGDERRCRIARKTPIPNDRNAEEDADVSLAAACILPEAATELRRMAKEYQE